MQLVAPPAAGTVGTEVPVVDGDSAIGVFSGAVAGGVDIEADGVAELGELGGALLVPEGLGLGPHAAISSSEAAAVVVRKPVLMR